MTRGLVEMGRGWRVACIEASQGVCKTKVRGTIQGMGTHVSPWRFGGGQS